MPQAALTLNRTTETSIIQLRLDKLQNVTQVLRLRIVPDANNSDGSEKCYAPLKLERRS
ncbi:hypothetical protein KGM_213524 [Danaus plexippus plexippus]|uniref:Uncharacterized protein n=1 Tax=Danaus plexippus plexippus TaxID=278856 RepID=A0A212EL45_DANPL|nr:hypothetical protein KGM_213524 [Danaus plexippus plexippus]